MNRNLESIVPVSHRDLLDLRVFAHTATTGPGGAPQVNPLGFYWDGARLMFTSAPTSQKVRNLQRDPRLALSVIDPVNPGRYLEIRGVATSVAPDPTRQLMRKLMLKCLGQETAPDGMFRDDWVIVTVQPHRVTFSG